MKKTNKQPEPKKFDWTKRHMMYCEPCGHKSIIEPNAKPNLPEAKSCPIQTGIPMIDPAAKQTVYKPFVEQPPKFKCPRCGRAVRVRELLQPYSDAIKVVEKEKEERRVKEDRQRRFEDGKPVIKAEPGPTPDFMG